MPSATTFADALHQAWTAEELEKQLGEMHSRVSHPSRKENNPKEAAGGGKPGKAEIACGEAGCPWGWQ